MTSTYSKDTHFSLETAPMVLTFGARRVELMHAELDRLRIFSDVVFRVTPMIHMFMLTRLVVVTSIEPMTAKDAFILDLHGHSRFCESIDLWHSGNHWTSHWAYPATHVSATESQRQWACHLLAASVNGDLRLARPQKSVKY